MRKGEKNTLFQFHKGTIKTTADIERIHQETRFQFHKGTIKTRHLYQSKT